MDLDYCPACSVRPFSGNAFQPDFNAHATALFRCDHCDSVVLDPTPNKDYTTHTRDEIGLRDYVEMNCSIQDIIAAVMPGIEAVSPKTYLDIGCGFGFSLDVARRLGGCDVVGVDPAYYGRVGAQELGVPILPEPLTGPPDMQASPELKRRFDMVFSSEVIEHVHDPDGFLALMKAYCTDDGLVVVTTPRAESLLESRSASEKLAVVSPTAHVFLYSASALDAALRRAGFTHIEIIAHGVTQIAYAAHRPFSIPEINSGALAETYLKSALPDAKADSFLAAGLGYRLFRNLVERGDYEQAATLEPLIEFRIAPEGLHVANHREYLQSFRACEGSLAYFRAMHFLNFHARYDLAHDWFVSAFRLCSEIIRVAPGSSVVESDLVWRAVFHAALAARYSDRPDQAQEIWTLAQSKMRQCRLPRIQDDIRARFESDLGPGFAPPDTL